MFFVNVLVFCILTVLIVIVPRKIYGIFLHFNLGFIMDDNTAMIHGTTAWCDLRGAIEECEWALTKVSGPVSHYTERGRETTPEITITTNSSKYVL